MYFIKKVKWKIEEMKDLEFRWSTFRKTVCLGKAILLSALNWAGRTFSFAKRLLRWQPFAVSMIFGLLVCATLEVVILAEQQPQSLGDPAEKRRIYTLFVSPGAAAVLSGESIQFAANLQGKPARELTWYVNGLAGGSAVVGTISSEGLYTAPAVKAPRTYFITAANSKGRLSEAAVVTVLLEGWITPTRHPLVAKYAFLAPPGSAVQIQFGQDEDYGLRTWNQPAPANGGEVDILVAGMRGAAIYHMSALITLGNGTFFRDRDHTFITGNLPIGLLPTITATTTPGQLPQPGVELIDMVSPPVADGIDAIVTDLNGNVIWYYEPVLPLVGPGVNPVKLLPNGHLLLNYTAGPLDGENSILQEADLAGNVAWQMNSDDLNKALAAATCAGCNVTVIGTHHDFAVLPNGHLVVLASMNKFLPKVDGFPNGTNVLGDVVIDLDQNRKPVWLWSTFDHLDINRHPVGLSDWTHSNAIVYSPEDHSLIVSMRHQSWVIKIDYNDGEGTGDILWKLGYQGDFALTNGTSPVDWQYGQHDFNLIVLASEERPGRQGNRQSGSREKESEAGAFKALLFDNGNFRVLDSNGNMCSNGTSCYSRVVVFHIDENAKTADIKWVDTLPVLSFFGGSSRLLANGNIEFDECGLLSPVPHSIIYEVTQTSLPLTVWQMEVTGWFAYRGFRIPSLYPGVQW